MIGQIVLDTIYRYKAGKTRDLGGLAYSITAMDSLMGPGDRIVPMTRIGTDAIKQVAEFLKTLSPVSLDGIIEDERANNRVELRYVDAGTRKEKVTGGVGSMQEDDLHHLEDLDGLLINLVSGREVSPEVLSGIKDRFTFPVHIDLHSYLIGYDDEGIHYWRRPDEWKDWLDFCDILQVNRHELVTLAGEEGEIFDLGEDVWRLGSTRGLSCLLVTDGEGGSWGWYTDESGNTRRCHTPAMFVAPVVDPTGSGDVYGSAFFYSRLKGDSIELSMRLAARLAAFNCARSGTSGLGYYLREKEEHHVSGDRAGCNREGIVK
jgi:sugar/nucleoside kinase (ribokinase family)